MGYATAKLRIVMCYKKKQGGESGLTAGRSTQHKVNTRNHMVLQEHEMSSAEQGPVGGRPCISRELECERPGLVGFWKRKWHWHRGESRPALWMYNIRAPNHLFFITLAWNSVIQALMLLLVVKLWKTMTYILDFWSYFICFFKLQCPWGCLNTKLFYPMIDFSLTSAPLSQVLLEAAVL